MSTVWKNEFDNQCEATMEQFIAERKLLYSLKSSDVQKEFFVRLGAPYHVEEGTVDFSVGKEGCSGCHIEIVGLDETYPEVYGADSLQALSLATSAIESFLKRLQKKYDLYWLTGEPYFGTPESVRPDGTVR